VACATYTHARRHPMVLGKIGDWTPPFQLTMAQVGVLLGVLFLEVQTWRYWGGHLHPVLAVAVFIGLPGGLAWAVRRARIEGRSLPRAVAGWMIFLARPRAGRVGGRAYRPARSSALARYSTYVAAGDPGDGLG
jgi:conjugation transfer TcpE-like protein